MNILMYLLIIFNFFTDISGWKYGKYDKYAMGIAKKTLKEVLGNEDCKKPLGDAGCDEEGHLLAENVCLNSSYYSAKPPNFPTVVYIRLFEWPRILDINEASSTVSIQFSKNAILWKDPRIEINMDKLEDEKLLQLPLCKNECFLPIPLQNICDEPLIEENDVSKLWTPLHVRIQIEGAIKSKMSDPEDEWGVQEIGMKFSSPLKQSKPLISMKMRFIVTIRCNFIYKGYPMDNQLCKIRFSTDRLKRLVFFLDDPKGICDESNKGYQVNGFHVSPSCVNDTKGELHEIGVDFYLKRVITAHLLQHFLPSAIIVFVSQASFQIPLTAIPGRISLVVTLFLALTNIFINEQSKSPANTEFTGMGAYILVSLMFVVATILELTALLILKKKWDEKIGLMEKDGESTKRNIIQFQSLIKKIDKISTILFPLMFFMFNLIYFAIML